MTKVKVNKLHLYSKVIQMIVVYLKNLAGEITPICLHHITTGEDLYDSLVFDDDRVRVFREDRELYLDDVIQSEEVLSTFYVDRNPMLRVEIVEREQLESYTEYQVRITTDGESVVFTFYYDKESFYDDMESQAFTQKEFFIRHSQSNYLLYRKMFEEWNATQYWRKFKRNKAES